MCVFRRIRVVATSACYPRHVRPSFYLHMSARLPLDGFQWIFRLRPCMKTCRGFQILLKSNKHIGQFTWRSKYVLLVPASVSRDKSALFHGNCIRLLVSPPILPSVRLSKISARNPPNRFTWNWRLLCKSVEEFQIWFKSDKIMERFTQIPEYVMLLTAT